MKRYIKSPFFLLLLLSTAASAQDNTQEIDDADFFLQSFSFSLSHPLIISGALGVVIPIAEADPDFAHRSVLSLRADAEIGIGGGMTSLGVHIPLDDISGGVNVRLARLKTWLVGGSDMKDKSFDGVIFELATLGHVPGKIGLGYFEERGLPSTEENHFYYLAIGVGW